MNGPKLLNMPWHQASHYWVAVLPRSGTLPAGFVQEMTDLGWQDASTYGSPAHAIRTGRNWGESWADVYSSLETAGLLDTVDAAVVSADDPGGMPDFSALRKSVVEIQSIAQSLWLGDALTADRLTCYFQPVVSAPGNIYGYESFARVQHDDGKIIGGGAIVEASRILSLQYAVDRHMQIRAVQSFVQGKFSGSLFINFIPGFIQRPEVYLEGLNDAVKAYGVVPRQIVLDVTNSQSGHDMQHVGRVCEFARSRGFAVALDDVESAASMKEMLGIVRPNFVKVEMQLARCADQPAGQAVLKQIVEECHASGIMVLAEGVETEQAYDHLKALGVDLFQGYLFSPPVPIQQLASSPPTPQHVSS